MKNLFLKDFFGILNKSYNYAVLRGYENLPEVTEGRDIDILVDIAQFESLKSDIGKLIKKYDYKIVMINKLDIYTVILAKRLGNKLDFIFIDFFFNSSLFGIELQSSNEILSRKLYNGNVFHVSLLDEFLNKYLNARLLNRVYPDKYKHVMNEVNDKNIAELEKALTKIFNHKHNSLDSCSKISSSRLLLTAVISSVSRQPLNQLFQLFKFYYCYLISWLKPNGFSISFTGPDGSGKTTVLTSVSEAFSNIYRKVSLHHFRPTVIPRIAVLLNKLGLKKEVDVQYDKPHRGDEPSKTSSLIRLTYYLVDYIAGYFLVIKPVLFRRGVVVFDRYFTDVISDSRRSRIGLNYKWVFPFRRLVPKMDYSFIIFVEPSEILKRKQELTRDQIDTIYEKLNYICNKDQHYVRINNNTSPDHAANAIIDYILLNQHKKYSKYLK